MAATSSSPKRSRTASSTNRSQAIDPAKYMADYRKRRKAEPLLRLQKKLRMMKPKELLALERTADTLLGPKRLPNPANPWAK